MLHLVSLWLGSAAVAETPTVPDPVPSTPSGDASFAATLEDAKQRYFRGETGAARELLQGLQLRVYTGEHLDWDLVADALIYLGEIYYNEGNQDQAEVLFRYLLEHDPNTPISAFRHPVEVVNLFELVRSTVLKSRLGPPVPVTPPPPAPVPTWAVLPLGIPQFGERRPAAGLAYFTLEAGFAAGSLTLLDQLQRVKSGDLEWDESRVRLTKYGYQWPLTIAFYLTWGVSAADAIRYHQRHAVAPALSASPDGTPTVGVGGRF
jgi:tetratricopeptide (TPR) repeat protein